MLLVFLAPLLPVPTLAQVTNFPPRPPTVPNQAQPLRKAPTPPSRPAPPAPTPPRPVQLPPVTLPPGVQVFPAQPAPRIVLPGGQPAQPALDPLLQLMMQQPSIDIESPAMVLTDFDPPVIPVGGRATYRIVITALNEVIKVPDQIPTPRGLTVTPGGRAHTFFNLGTKLQPRTTINYRVTATAPGQYTIPPFSVTVSDKFVQVPSAKLQVVPAGAAPMPEQPRMLVRVPAGDLYVGQTIPIQVMVTDPGGNLVRGLTRVEIPSEGFLADTAFYRQRRDTVMQNGRPMAVLAQEMYVTPIKAGELVLMAQGQAILGQPTPGQLMQLPGYYPLLDADPVKLTVKRLPKDGELPGFTGAIGTFMLEQPRLSTNRVRAGEPVTLTVAIKGQGNLARLIPPKLEGLWEWQTFEPTSDSAQPQLVQQRGFCTFNYTLIPLSERITATPGIPFCFFDPQKGTYTDLTVPPVPMEVLPAPAGTVLPPLGVSRTSTGDDYRPEGDRELVMNGLSETPGVLASSLRPVQQRLGWVLVQLLPGAALGGLWLWDRRRRFLTQHPEVVLKARARQGLRRYWRLLRRAAADRDAGGFVKASVNALRAACAPHGAANPEALVCGDVLREIPAPERQGAAGDIVRRLFATADLIQFGGAVPDGPQILGLKPDLERVLERLRARL